MIPIDQSDKVKTSHYFLIVASITESNLIGRAEHSRYILTYLHQKMEDHLFKITDPDHLHELLIRYPSYNVLGIEKEKIPETICEVNRYVNDTANSDLFSYYTQFDKPKEFVDDIESHIPSMSGYHVEKAWMYLRWLTRTQDLGVFNKFDPKDLMLPLTSYIREVFYRLGKCPDHDNWPPNKNKIEESRIQCTELAKELFPEDPTKVDCPFYLLGRWLKGRPHRTRVLYDSLMFFKEISRPDYYKTLQIDISRDTRLYIESKIKQELEKHGVDHERYIFNMPHDCMAPFYTPDFILPTVFRKGRRVLLEPHGVNWSSTEPSRRTIEEIEFIDKLWNFRNEFGKEYYIILFVPEQEALYVDVWYAHARIFDEIWSFSDIPRVIGSLKMCAR